MLQAALPTLDGVDWRGKVEKKVHMCCTMLMQAFAENAGPKLTGRGIMSSCVGGRLLGTSV